MPSHLSPLTFDLTAKQPCPHPVMVPDGCYPARVRSAVDGRWRRGEATIEKRWVTFVGDDLTSIFQLPS